MASIEAEIFEPREKVELYPGVIDDTINRALGMKALFLVEDV